jgi:carbonic anhydrase
MKRISPLIVCTVFSLLSHSQLTHHTPHWSYLGATGPAHWGDLSSDFSTCKTGHQQSPINITNPVPSDLPAIDFHYEPATLKIIDNGHTVQVNYPPGSYITAGNQRYQLLQFHFHHPSEELIEGKAYDLVIHLVHQDAEEHKAVVAVLVNQGQNNPVLDTIFSHLPKSKEKEVATEVSINVRNLLPSERSYYTFPGSLTTPPCSEGVTWFVLKTPLTVSKSALTQFTRLYPHNARPVQRLNGRQILAAR